MSGAVAGRMSEDDEWLNGWMDVALNQVHDSLTHNNSSSSGVYVGAAFAVRTAVHAEVMHEVVHAG